MRKYLFRGKTKATNKWITGGICEMDGRYFIVDAVYYAIDNSQSWGLFEVGPETVSQYTGWNDNHKAKIFENDIVEFVSGTTSHRYLIWWQREGNMLTAVPLDGMTFNGSDYWNGNYPQFDYSTFCLMMLDPYGDFRDIRVIGNIHDNPELLEE